MPAGRPSSFKTEYIAQARKLCALGATDIEIADFFSVHVATLHRWKNDFPEFRDALKEAKADADARVEASLYHRAIGYEHDAVKIVADAKTGESLSVPFRERYPPDTTAAIFWLKNRQPARWRDRQDVALTGENGGPVVHRIERVIVRPDEAE